MYFLVLNSVIGRKEPQFSHLSDSPKQDVAHRHTTDFHQAEEINWLQIRENSPEVIALHLCLSKALNL